MSNTYDLSSLVSLENVVAKMNSDQIAVPSTFSGGSLEGGSAGRFIATFATVGLANATMTSSGLRRRVQTLLLEIERLSR